MLVPPTTTTPSHISTEPAYRNAPPMGQNETKPLRTEQDQHTVRIVANTANTEKTVSKRHRRKHVTKKKRTEDDRTDEKCQTTTALLAVSIVSINFCRIYCVCISIQFQLRRFTRLLTSSGCSDYGCECSVGTSRCLCHIGRGGIEIWSRLSQSVCVCVCFFFLRFCAAKEFCGCATSRGQMFVRIELVIR